MNGLGSIDWKGRAINISFPGRSFEWCYPTTRQTLPHISGRLLPINGVNPTSTNPGLPKGLTFNLSHTDKLIVMAVGLDGDIGVDAEFIGHERPVLDVAHRYFSPSELEALFALPKTEQRSRFYDLWTLKEAYIKACGMGLAIGLDHFSFDFFEGAPITIECVPERGEQPALWQFWQIHPNRSHKVAAAVKTRPGSPPWRLVMKNCIPGQLTSEVHYATSGHALTH